MSELVRSPELLGSVIRRARKKSGLSQAELGKKAGVRQETISLIEKGNSATKLETLLGILSALELDLEVSDRKSSFDHAFDGGFD